MNKKYNIKGEKMNKNELKQEDDSFIDNEDLINQKQNLDIDKDMKKDNEKNNENKTAKEDQNTLTIEKEEYEKLLSAKEEANKKLLYSMAEFDNCKKRLNKETEDRIRFANESLILDILPVLDNFNLALDHLRVSNEKEDEKHFQKLLSGVEMIKDQLCSVLDKYGVQKIPAINEDFNPNFHEAINQASSLEHESGKIIKEYQTGYTLKDRLIRCSKVCVCKNNEDSLAKDNDASANNCLKEDNLVNNNENELSRNKKK
jgi:molecular chaperone GrpE